MKFQINDNHNQSLHHQPQPRVTAAVGGGHIIRSSFSQRKPLSSLSSSSEEESTAVAAALRHREGSTSSGSSRSRSGRTTDDHRRLQQHHNGSHRKQKQQYKTTAGASIQQPGGGIVFHPTTIAKVAEEFKYRREQVRNLSNALQDKESIIIKLRSHIDKIQNEFVSYKSNVQHELLKRQTRMIQSTNDETRQVMENDRRMEEYEGEEAKIHRKEQIINQYKNQIRIQSQELDEMRNDLIASQKREIELSIDLDIHDFKFISHQNHQRLLDMDGIEKMDVVDSNEDNNNPNGNTATIITPRTSTSRNNEQQQYYIQKLITDYEKMEKLYVKSRLDASDEIGLLGEELQVANSKIQRLQHSIAAFQQQHHYYHQKSKEGHNNNHNSNTDVDISFDSSAAATATTTSDDTTAPFLSFESDAATAHDFMLSITTTATPNPAAYNSAAAAAARKCDNGNDESTAAELASIRIENHGLIQKVSALQIELSVLEGNINNTARLKRYRILEKNIDEYIADIMRLEEQLRIKERIINRLSSQLLEEKLAKVKNCLDYYEQSSITSSLITQVASNIKGGEEKNDDDGNNTEVDEMNLKYVNTTKKKNIRKNKSQHSTLVVDMESQLALALEQNKKKDELFKYVRGKYSARVAQLKLRIEKDSYYLPPKQKPDFYFI